MKKELTIIESGEYASKYPYDGNAPQCAKSVRFDGDAAGLRKYSCTRPRGHKGEHVAHAHKGPIAAWS